MKAKVAIIMGSETDHPILKQAEEILRELKISFHTEVVSAHRTPEKMVNFAKSAAKSGYSVVIAGAGGSAHLPGMIASLTTLPVIGVPIQLGNLKGLDALLSIVQMPKGVPVATVAIDSGANAGLLAARILGISDDKISQKLLKHQEKQRQKVKGMNKRLKSKTKS
jgi:5-(carboxyamino)imidazole ribonucleotide mutase